MAYLDLKVPPLAVWTVCALAVAAAAHWLPATNVPFPGHRLLGLLLVLCGIAVAVAGVAEFKRAKTTVNPLAPGKASSVVATGIYRFTRNPMYLGMASALLGTAAWWASPPALLVVGAFCAYITHFQVRPEERALLQLFGEPFALYMSRVRRWI